MRLKSWLVLLGAAVAVHGLILGVTGVALEGCSSTAEAQVQSSCGPGRVCSVQSLTCGTRGANAHALTLQSGTLACFNGSTCSSYAYGSGTSIRTSSVVAEGASAGQNALSVVNAGARVDFGPGLNDWASSDGGVVHFESATETAGNAIFNGTATFSSTMGTNGLVNLQSTLGFGNQSAAREPVYMTDAEGFRLVGVTSANMVALDGGFAGTLQYETDSKHLTVVEGNARNYLITARAPCVVAVDAGPVGGLSCIVLPLPCAAQTSYRGTPVMFSHRGASSGIIYQAYPGDAGFVELQACNVSGDVISPATEDFSFIPVFP